MGNAPFLWEIILSTFILGCSTNINNDNQTLVNLAPVQVERGVTIDPKIEKELQKKKEEQLKPVSGLFKTSLESVKEDGKIKLTFSLQNVSGKDQQISYGSGQWYDIFVYNEKNEEVYKWSNNKSFITVLIERNLTKDEYITYMEEWNLTNNDGNPVPPGNYTIEVKAMIGMKSKTINPDDLTAKTILEFK